MLTILKFSIPFIQFSNRQTARDANMAFEDKQNETDGLVIINET